MAEGTACKRDVKDNNGNLVKCGAFLPRGKPECPNRENHMWKFKSGFCNSGWHEGTAPVDGSGKPMKGCHLWQHCNCDCHTKLDKMFSMSGQERVFVENPKYRTEKSPFVMPNPLEMAELRRAAEATATSTQAPQVPAILRETKQRHFVDTPSGKRQRGQLEYEVLRVCQDFSKGLIEQEILTPVMIANDIDEVDPPSVGAIGAIFDRWVKLGFANCEKKPVRFSSFTVDGQMYGLDAMKERAKQKNKHALAEANRGKLRPRK